MILLHLFVNEGVERANGDYAAALSAAIPSTSESISVGENGIFIDGCSVRLRLEDGKYIWHTFHGLKSSGRLKDGGSLQLLSGHSVVASSLATCPSPALVIVALERATARLYHLVQHTARGALYVCYFATKFDALASEIPGVETMRVLLGAARSRWDSVHALLSDDCAYSKWRSDMEMERKFTFSDIPDTWRLAQDLHASICTGQLSGFVPELDRDFQVFDYESHIFSVDGPPHEQGYISFIPQADGRMTVKRKWFTKNAEIRRESLYPNQDVRADAISDHVLQRVEGSTTRLPSFRRKRFDVNFESLTTGNVYGVYFDICRIVKEPKLFLSQCEVEYCRSRTFEALRQVTEEFERVAAFTEAYLSSAGELFEQNLYSKLDFVRHASRSL